MKIDGIVIFNKNQDIVRILINHRLPTDTSLLQIHNAIKYFLRNFPFSNTYENNFFVSKV